MYKLAIDAGCPFELSIDSEEELRAELVKLNAASKTDDYPYMDVTVYNDKGEDITESQFIEEMIREIIGD